MWLGCGHGLGEAEFQGIIWAEQPLLSSLMMSLLAMAALCPHPGSGEEQWVPPALLPQRERRLRPSFQQLSDPCKSLVPPEQPFKGRLHPLAATAAASDPLSRSDWAALCLRLLLPPTVAG